MCRERPALAPLARSLSPACIAGALWFALTADDTLGTGLFAVLSGVASSPRFLTTRVDGTLMVSATFATAMLAVGLLGRPPRSRSSSRRVDPVDGRALPAACPGHQRGGGRLPALVAGAAFPAVDPGSTAFPLVLAGFTLGAIVVNFVAVSAADRRWRDGLALSSALRPRASSCRRSGFNVALTVALGRALRAGGPRRDRLRGAHGRRVLLHGAARGRGRERARAYAALSWGVLSGLLRTLDERDPRAARHGAGGGAVLARPRQAAWPGRPRARARHTAGLLHDIGRFASPTA